MIPSRWRKDAHPGRFLIGRTQDLPYAGPSAFDGFDGEVKATCKIGRLQSKIAQK
jgi:hypothetical protein